jgi:hypothetical protein
LPNTNESAIIARVKKICNLNKAEDEIDRIKLGDETVGDSITDPPRISFFLTAHAFHNSVTFFTRFTLLLE